MLAVRMLLHLDDWDFYPSGVLFTLLRALLHILPAALERIYCVRAADGILASADLSFLHNDC